MLKSPLTGLRSHGNILWNLFFNGNNVKSLYHILERDSKVKFRKTQEAITSQAETNRNVLNLGISRRDALSPRSTRHLFVGK